MADHPVVSRDEWLAARRALLAKEKEFTKQREALTDARRNLPWVKVDKDYVFDGPDGRVSLADLFGNRSQLIVYHFMFGPDWPDGCKVCSMFADHFDPMVTHLAQRDVALVAVSRAPLAKLQAYRQRMGWTFNWLSSFGTEFNWDYQASCRQEDLDAGRVFYNFEVGAVFPATEMPGISTFVKRESGDVFHTYSAYARGLETFLGIYYFLDIVPKGRDEESLRYPMEWVRQKDRYDDASFVDPFV